MRPLGINNDPHIPQYSIPELKHMYEVLNSMVYPSISNLSYMNIIKKCDEIVNAILMQSPEDFEALTTKGTLLIIKARYFSEDQEKPLLLDRAKFIFECALRIDPQDSSAWLGFTEVMGLQFTLLHYTSAP